MEKRQEKMGGDYHPLAVEIWDLMAAKFQTPGPEQFAVMFGAVEAVRISLLKEMESRGIRIKVMNVPPEVN